MRKALWLVLLAGCDRPAAPPPAATLAALPMSELGGFAYEPKMKLPDIVTKWNGARVRATGYINPMKQTRDLQSFLLVKDLGSCCFGKFPQTNHYVDVKLKPGQSVNYNREPVTVEGVIKVEERFDGDWPLGLYWMEGAEVLK